MWKHKQGDLKYERLHKGECIYVHGPLISDNGEIFQLPMYIATSGRVKNFLTC